MSRRRQPSDPLPQTPPSLSVRQPINGPISEPDTVSDTSSSNVVGASAKGATYLILLQLFTRLLTFTFNHLILRHTSPSTFGLATIQLDLLISTILFLSRDGFRISLQRHPGHLQRTVNLSYIPLATGLLGTCLGCGIFLSTASEQVKQIGGFRESVLLFGLSAVIELVGEMGFNVSQQMLLFWTRSLAEGLGVLVKCLGTYFWMVWFLRRGRLEEVGAIPFGLGQLAYSTVVTGVYLIVLSRKVNLLPKKITPLQTEANKGEDGKDGSQGTGEEGGYWFHGPSLRLAFGVTGQSLFKHLLTEGDKLVLTFLTTPYTQGIYSVVSNYGTPQNSSPLKPLFSLSLHPFTLCGNGHQILIIGSLIARILFQPTEETLRTILSHLLSTPTPSTLTQSQTLISILLKTHILLATLIHVLIPPIISSIILPILTTLLGQARFPVDQLTAILYAYLYYIPIMAINGVTESFISSIATTSDLAKQSRAMIFFSMIFLAVSWVLLRQVGLAGEGLVWANCVNLGVRIMWSMRFISRWYRVRGKRVSWRRCLPRTGSVIAAAGVSVGMRILAGLGMLEGFVWSVFVVGMAALGLLGCMYDPY